MLEAPIPPDEALRLETLRRLSLLDSEAEERFDRLTRMARRVFNVPIALVSLVDEDRQWFKSCIGLEVRETARDISFCGHAIMGNETFIVPDASQDPRFADNPLGGQLNGMIRARYWGQNGWEGIFTLHGLQDQRDGGQLGEDRPDLPWTSSVRHVQFTRRL